MNTPEALRLALRIEYPQLVLTPETRDAAAAELRRQHAEIERLTAAHHAAVELSNTMHGRWLAAEAERDALRKALMRVKTEAVSLADAQVIALEALKGDKP
jgi:hypothetical protein